MRISIPDNNPTSADPGVPDLVRSSLRTDRLPSAHRSYPSKRRRVNLASRRGQQRYTSGSLCRDITKNTNMADMDEFAQTRGDDDLFDDEIIPVSAEEQQAQTEVVIPEPEPVPQEETPVIEKQPPSRGHTPQRGRGGDRGRGRGRGRGKGGRGLQDSQFADPERAESPRNKGAAKTPEADATRDTDAATPNQPQEEVKDQTGPDEEGKDTILIAIGAEPQRVPAVKGDRSATGGVRKVRRRKCYSTVPGRLTNIAVSPNSPRRNLPNASPQRRRTPLGKQLLMRAPKLTRLRSWNENNSRPRSDARN